MRIALNHVQINLPPPPRLKRLKKDSFSRKCEKGALRPAPGCDHTLILIYYPPGQYIQLEDLTSDLLASEQGIISSERDERLKAASRQGV